jgi:hypothetical protein
MPSGATLSAKPLTAASVDCATGASGAYRSIGLLLLCALRALWRGACLAAARRLSPGVFAHDVSENFPTISCALFRILIENRRFRRRAEGSTSGQSDELS